MRATAPLFSKGKHYRKVLIYYRLTTSMAVTSRRGGICPHYTQELFLTAFKEVNSFDISSS
jgi:hypothetical protein